MSASRWLSRSAAALKLGYWLGPWSNERRPRGVSRTRHVVGATTAYLYEPRATVAGVYLVLPGLHFNGPDDPRLDRFCRILAASGFVVVAPFIRAYAKMRLDPSAFEDAEAAYAFACARAGGAAPAVFSISFGSVLALRLGAARGALPAPAALVLFGGYAEFAPTVRFAVSGRAVFDGEAHELPRDPLNSPVVYLNVLEQLDVPGDRELLARAWCAMVYRTWGKMELKRPGARDPIAHAIAETLPADLRLPFLRGCCLTDDHMTWLEAALEKAAEPLSFLDPSRDVPDVKSPVVIVHGKDDDVIPWFEALKLSRALPPDRVRAVHLTGLYGHTGAASPGVRDMLTEAATLVRMLGDLTRAPG